MQIASNLLLLAPSFCHAETKVSAPMKPAFPICN